MEDFLFFRERFMRNQVVMLSSRILSCMELSLKMKVVKLQRKWLFESLFLLLLNNINILRGRRKKLFKGVVC